MTEPTEEAVERFYQLQAQQQSWIPSSVKAARDEDSKRRLETIVAAERAEQERELERLRRREQAAAEVEETGWRVRVRQRWARDPLRG